MNKFLQLLKKINGSNFAKTVTGVIVVLAGAGISFIPAVGPVAAPYVMTAGTALIVGGTIDKVIRYNKGDDPLQHEKAIIASIKGKLNNSKPAE